MKKPKKVKYVAGLGIRYVTQCKCHNPPIEAWVQNFPQPLKVFCPKCRKPLKEEVLKIETP